MTLTDQQAKLIVKTNPNKTSINIKQEKHKVLKAHVTGIGDETLIKLIENFERREYGKTREALRMSNKDMIYRVMQPRNKIYTAKGGVEAYTMSSPELADDFKVWLSSVRGTQSLKDYIRQNIQPMYDYDPEGLVWLDLDNDGLPLPCFKSIMQIYDYELVNRKPEYVVFSLSAKEVKQLNLRAVANNRAVNGSLIQVPESKPSSTKKVHKVFRCVCDSFDRIIVYDNVGDPEIVSQIVNPFRFMGVPGMIVSNLVGAGNDYEDVVYDSCLNPAIDILNQIIFSRSLFNVAYSRVAYPKEWMTKMPCGTCGGAKMVSDATCPECHGTGVLPFQMHNDVLVVDYANDSNKGIPTPPMGHVETDVPALQFMEDGCNYWEDMFSNTIWGLSKITRNNLSTKATHSGNVSNTAYEAQLNEQPKHDKLIDFSLWAFELYKWYADGCGKFIYDNSYIDSGIMGGTRFMVESADATFDRLVKARNGGATKSELDSLTLEYLENRYANNALMYKKYYILYIAEPFYHDSIKDVLGWDIPEINKMEKIFFDEWSATLTDEYFAMCPDDGLSEKVKNDLREYTLTRVGMDASADTVMYSAMGNLLNVGDIATVKKDKALSKGDLGKQWKVTAINGRYASLVSGDGGNEVKVDGYSVKDLVKQNV